MAQTTSPAALPTLGRAPDPFAAVAATGPTMNAGLPLQHHPAHCTPGSSPEQVHWAAMHSVGSVGSLQTSSATFQVCLPLTVLGNLVDVFPLPASLETVGTVEHSICQII